jgi:hypothetical protein
MRVRWLPLSVFLAMILASVLGPEPGLSAEFACDRIPGGSPLEDGPVTRLAGADDNPVPTILSLHPASATVGGTAFTLVVNGADFIRGSVVRWNDSDRGTGFVSSSQLQATIATADIATAGTASVTVFNPAPGGGTSNALTFTISNPLPLIHSLNPSSVVAGEADLTLAVVGAGFVPSSVVQWNGFERQTTFVSRNQVHAAIHASDVSAAGEVNVTVFSPPPGGGMSNARTFTVNYPQPEVDDIDPRSATAGGLGFTLAVYGANLVSDSLVRWNGQDRETSFVSSSQLTATIAASDIVTPGVASVTVFTPAPGGGTSIARMFSIDYPLPTITHLEPAWARAGGVAFTLAVNGKGFFRGSVVRWNGSARGTTFVSSTRLRATITAPDVALPGAAAITVVNPAPGGGTSDPHRFPVYDREVKLFLPVVMRGHHR